MKFEHLVESLNLEDRHFRRESKNLPIVDASIYTTLGRRLFEFYKKYNIPETDQREFERLSFVLMSFTLETEPKPRVLDRLKKVLKVR